MNELNRLRIRTCIWFAWFAWTIPALCSAQITLTAYGGGTGSQTSVLATGWNTVALTMTAGNMAPDANGDFIGLGGSNIYFTEAVIDQN